MSEIDRKLQRILLPLDVSRDSLTALEIAFNLAASLGSEIAGLFIEDPALLLAGSLPFAREVGSLSGIRRQIGSEDIEHRFRAVASKARQAILEAGDRLKVRSSFRVARGEVPAEILTAAMNSDLVVLGKAGWAVGGFRPPGSTCLTILARSRVPVLIVERGAKLSPPIVVVNDGTPAGQRATEFGRALSRLLGWEIAVFSAQGMAHGEDVVTAMRQDQPHLVVLPSSLPLSERASQLRCPVVFVP